jgi:D-glycero-D-manno-heptose 1,7-bisphosphate phosphatase
MNKALFLDRDGVINYDSGYTHKIHGFTFKQDVFSFVKEFYDKGYLIFIITNQSGIARGYYTIDQFNQLTAHIHSVFKENNINITKTYFSPYHIHGVIPEFTRHSACRKPGSGMIFQAKQEYNIDLSQSVLIGDQETDIQAGKNAGINHNFLFIGSFRRIKLECQALNIL